MEIVHLHFPSLSSTNDWGKEHLSSFDHAVLTLVTADAQTAARGRFGRRWEAPADLNLYATFCFFLTEGDPLALTHVMALSAIKTIESYQVSPKIKWPNDLLINQKKIAGILCETVPLGSQQGIVLGIGLNVNMTPEQLKKIDQQATSLLVETGHEISVKEVLEKLSGRFQKDLELYKEKGFDPFSADFHRYSISRV